MGRWCDIIVLNVHATSEDKDDDIKYSFYEEIERLFDQLSIYHMKILLGDFNAVGRKIIFLSATGTESIHAESNDKGIRLVKISKEHNISTS